MSNLIDNNYRTLRLRINEDYYWDFFINKDKCPAEMSSSGMSTDGLGAWIDLDYDECIGDDCWIYSRNGYKWENAVSNGLSLKNIGFTGVDNGLIKFRKDRVSNDEFADLYQNSVYEVESGDTRLQLHCVSGSTMKYEYPIEISGHTAILNGGFYQGIFKTTCDTYYILPSTLESGDEWDFEFVLNKCDLEPESDKTLNDKYPENKGIFFFMGTRAEDKWTYLYDPNNEELDSCKEPIESEDPCVLNPNDFTDPNPDYLSCSGCSGYIPEESTSGRTIIGYQVIKTPYVSCGCGRRYREKRIPIYSDTIIDSGGTSEYCDFDYIASEKPMSAYTFTTSGDLPLSGANQYSFETDNKFMMFDRTKDGYNVSNWVEGSTMEYYGTKDKYSGNLFVLMNRTSTGYNVTNISTVKESENQSYDVYSDLYNNAIAFQIDDNGSIGYRILTIDCSISGENKTSIISGMSTANVVSDCEWHNIHVRMIGYAETMKFMFYVDGKLKYVTKELPKVNFGSLEEIDEKQEGVAYNISIGGGTQGLADVILPDYMNEHCRVYPMEEYFAGSMIGYFKSFKFYTVKKNFRTIKNNFIYERNKW